MAAVSGLVGGHVAWLVKGLCLPALELPGGRARGPSLFLTHLKCGKGGKSVGRKISSQWKESGKKGGEEDRRVDEQGRIAALGEVCDSGRPFPILGWHFVFL